MLFQFLASNVSLLGHLCGILSGFACLSLISFLFVKSSRARLYFFNHIPCWAYLFGTRHLWAVQLLASWAIILFKNRRLASTSKFCLNGLSYPDHTIHLLYEMFLISVFIVWCIGCQSVCVRRPGFIMCTGGTTYGQLPTYSNTSAAPRYCFRLIPFDVMLTEVICYSFNLQCSHKWKFLEKYIFMDA